MASFSRKRKRGYRMPIQLAAESHVPCFQERVGTRHPGYMISDRLPWRLRARPSATLHEIQVRSEERTCSADVTEGNSVRSRSNFGRKRMSHLWPEFSGVLWKSPEFFFRAVGPTEFYEMLSATCRQRIRGYPPPPRRNGVIDLGENLPIIYGRQSVRRKILISKTLLDPCSQRGVLSPLWQ